MIEVWHGADRYAGGDAASGIGTRHAFSFGGHYDPGNVGFGVLVACNEERLAPGAGFTEHAHRDVEIVTWVLEGELEHRDGGGRTVRLGAGDAQRLSAGGGVRHSERNCGDGPLRFLQMWVRPEAFGGAPEYEVARGAVPAGTGPVLLASGAAVGGAPLRLRQRAAALRVGRPVVGGAWELPAAPFVYVHVVRGGVRVGGRTLGPGDAARISGGARVRAEADGPAEYLVWEMHGEPSYG
jgi:redox-sensitive bicupin YhaK (pirin superfamily)